MRVNSGFSGFSSNRWLVAPGIALLMLAIFVVASSFIDHTSRDLRAKQANLVIRQIGHRLLLQAGDSTSRVLPVTEIEEGTFLLKFESEMVFNHDSLMLLSQGLLPKTQFPSGYTVTVHDCTNGGIVYGFQVNNTTPDILACSGRRQPSGCYTIEFAFPDFYENVEQNKAVIESGEVHRQKGKPKIAAFKATTIAHDIDQPTEELKSTKVDPQEVRPKFKEFRKTTFEYTPNHLIYGAMLVLLGATLLTWHFRRIFKAVTEPNQNHATTEASLPELAALGKFLFNVKGQHLLLANEVIPLTDKECKVLELLHKNFGELLLRGTLMQEIWINEGVITGRSLDMFISKLRKKLSLDPDLRITNIHGKGYRLETVDGSIA